SLCGAKKSRHRNQHGGYNTHGGNSKVLSPWQEEAIRQYCYEQGEAGNGANFSMVMSSITHLRAKINQPHPAPTKRWFVSWLKKNPMLQIIYPKLISYARLDLHTEESVKEWFVDFYKTVGEFEIDNWKKILNTDESGAKEAIKIYTIKGAFQESGMWTLSLKAGFKKLRSSGRKKRTLEESLDKEIQPDLPLLPPNRPSDL
ncbi:putative multidrug resistance protein fnx1, partial [Golovinomyces cichoracearum]